MMILNIAIVVFVVMETSNIVILYFFPDSKLGNGVAVFNMWFKAKEDESSALFAQYMTNWVAGTKLIFVFLLVVILLVGNETTKIFGVVAVILSILTYYFRLDPLIRKLDALGEINPKGYSKQLFMMITGFVLMFSLALLFYFVMK